MQMDSRSSHPRILRGRASERCERSICMYIFIYIDTPYLRLLYALFNTRFRRKSRNLKKRLKSQFANVFRSAKPIQIQPINPNSINQRKNKQNPDMVWIFAYFLLFIAYSPLPINHKRCRRLRRLRRPCRCRPCRRSPAQPSAARRQWPPQLSHRTPLIRQAVGKNNVFHGENHIL